MDRQTRAHYTAVRQLHWLRVPDRITFKLPTLLLQCVNVTASGYLSSDVRRAWPMYLAVNTYTRQHHPCYCYRRSIGDRAFVVAAASVWNKLPRDIRPATSLSVFRRRQKTHLFVNADNC